jgi:apolipoprotein D and lipocalin family protein
MKNSIKLSLVPLVFLSCATVGEGEPFHKTADYVNLERFQGDWYVIALIPSIIEKNIANGVENYRLTEKGEIRVTYTFRKGSPLGKKKVTGQRGWVIDKKTNAEWRVRPIWPLKLHYYILEVGSNYEYTVIGTNNYDYLWIMARTPEMEGDLLEEIIGRMVDRGFDRDRIIFMEQSWEDGK